MNQRHISISAIIFLILLSLSSCDTEESNNPPPNADGATGKIIYNLINQTNGIIGIYSLDVGKLNAQPALLCADAIEPEVNSDGKAVLFAQIVNGSSDILRMNIDGLSKINLTSSKTRSDSWANWSPLDTAILFVGDSIRQESIYFMKQDGSSLRRLTDTAYFCTLPRWSPVENQFVCLKSDKGGPSIKQTLTLIHVGTKLERDLVPAEGGYFIKWSPNGKMIAYGSRLNNAYTAFVYDLEKNINFSFQTDSLRILPAGFAWTLDNNLLAVAQVAGEVTYDIVKVDGGKSIQRIDVDFHTINCIVQSYDGKYIGVFGRRALIDDFSFYTMKMDGSEFKNMAKISSSPSAGINQLSSVHWIR